MKELGEALKALLDKLSDFFDILDLSFFVSGAAATGALVFWGRLAGSTLSFSTSRWVNVVVVILACYIMGLLCFALGRWIRMGIRKPRAQNAFEQHFEAVLLAHDLRHKEPFESYFARVSHRGAWRLYVRLWAELRQSDRLAPSLSLLKRYWVMAATYDGVAFALAVWVVVLIALSAGVGIEASARPRWQVTVPIVVVLVLAAIACFREAGRYVKYQVEELVASIATARHEKA